MKSVEEDKKCRRVRWQELIDNSELKSGKGQCPQWQYCDNKRYA